MEKRTTVWTITALLIAAVAVWFVHEASIRTHLQPEPAASSLTSSHSGTYVAASNSTASQPAPNAGTNGSSDDSPMLTDIEAKYRQGSITKDEAILQSDKSRFNQPQRFYGKIIDQNRQPVAGAEVTGTIEVLSNLGEGLQNQTYTTQSDSEGLFEFAAKEGGPFNVTVKKEGYLLGDRGEGYQGPPGEKTGTYDRAIFTMWKLRGAEPLVTYSIDSRIPFDGTAVSFDIASEKIDPGGDLRVTLARTPLEVRRSGQAFDWTLRIEILHGGLLVENDPYPYSAPQGGYDPVFETNISSNSVSWYSHLTQNFYTINAHGQYGRMQADLYTALTPARVHFDFWINPSGSQNLEPWAAK